MFHCIIIVSTVLAALFAAAELRVPLIISVIIGMMATACLIIWALTHLRECARDPLYIFWGGQGAIIRGPCVYWTGATDYTIAIIKLKSCVL
jgi:hypothetical protein